MRFSFVMKRFTIILACTLLVCMSLLLCACLPNADNRDRHINSVNHRGYRDAPENTLAAFRMSKEKGFDMVECDVRFTKDNQAVLLHDATINRTSNGRGNVADLTLEEVRQFDFGSWKSKSYAGETIPTFEEFVDLCVELSLHPYVEVKGATLEQTQALADIINQANLAVTWISYNKDVLNWLVDLRSQDRFGLLMNNITDYGLQLLKDWSQKADVFMDANYVFVTSKQIKRCKKYGIPLEVWTVNNESVVKSLDEYVSGVTSDHLNAQEIFNNM